MPIPVGRFLITCFNDCVLGKSADPIIELVDPIPYLVSFRINTQRELNAAEGAVWNRDYYTVLYIIVGSTLPIQVTLKEACFLHK